MIRFRVPQKAAGERLDVFLAHKVPVLSRASIKKLIDSNKVSVDKHSQKSGYKLRSGNNIAVEFDVSQLSNIPDIKMPIIYEDDDCLVVNKPSGILSHSKGAFNAEASVATFIKDHLQGLVGDRAGIVHRLDRGTSGVMICAKNEAANKWIQKQFSQRKVKKEYLAIIKGELNPAAAIIDMPIERNPKHPQTFRVGANGRSALTEYLTKESANGFSLIELKPQTGRTHQLRVHLSHRGHPIVGDTFYNGPVHPRLLLHAHRLTLTLPNRTRQTFTAVLPRGFKDLMHTS